MQTKLKKPSLGCCKKHDDEKHRQFVWKYVLHEFLSLNLGSHIVTQLPKQYICIHINN